MMMENFSVLLFTCAMFAGFGFFVAIIIRFLRRKPKRKLYSRGLLISVLAFVLGFVLFGIFETPETKAEYEQIRIEEEQAKKQEEAEKRAKKEKEEKEQAEKEKAEKEKAKKEKADKEKADKEKAEKEKAEKEKAKKEKADKEKAKKEQVKKDTSEKKDTDKEKPSKPKPIEGFESNYLKQLKVRELPVMNGTGTEKIGTYGFFPAVKELTTQLSETEYLDFCNTVVRNSGYNWFTIDFTDGTGIVFSGSIPETGIYGKIDETRCITEPIKYISITDNTISVSDPTY